MHSFQTNKSQRATTDKIEKKSVPKTRSFKQTVLGKTCTSQMQSEPDETRLQLLNLTYFPCFPSTFYVQENPGESAPIWRIHIRNLSDISSRSDEHRSIVPPAQSCQMGSRKYLFNPSKTDSILKSTRVKVPRDIYSVSEQHLCILVDFTFRFRLDRAIEFGNSSVQASYVC